MRWFRFYDDVLNDRKVQRLSPHLFKTWVNLLCLASKGNGKLPCDDDIAYDLRISVQDAAQQIEDLILAGLIDIGPKGERSPHNWSERQYASDSSAVRTRKYRENKKKKPCDVTPTVTVTVQNRSEADKDSNGLTSYPDAAKGKAKTVGFDSGSEGKDWNEAERFDGVVDQAVRFDIPIDDLKQKIPKRAKSRAAYLHSMCVQDLQTRFPTIAENTLKAAMWGSRGACEAVAKALWEAAV